MSDDLERLVLEKHRLAAQQRILVSIIGALTRKVGGKDYRITLAKRETADFAEGRWNATIEVKPVGTVIIAVNQVEATQPTQRG